MSSPIESGYTREQILCGLKEAWYGWTGYRTPFDADTRIDEHMKADGLWDDTDLADVAYRMDQFRGLRPPFRRTAPPAILCRPFRP